MDTVNLNVGGGIFNYSGWINLDESTGFKLSADCTFPVDEAPIVYSSHCLEHLDDATVDRVLSEARRMGGRLVLKLPDFEEVLKRRAIGDHDYFRCWGMDPISHMWEKDTIDHRAAMIFCGYWNGAYGHEFTGERNTHAEGAYHGPPPIVAFDKSPHELAVALKANAPGGVTFNHQNAWSREELTALLEKHGFTVESMDAEKICQEEIPTIMEMYGISMYVIAR